jgi:hypothetical protein
MPDERDKPKRESALKPQWSKKVFSAEPQVDETNEREFAFGGGQAGIPFDRAYRRLASRTKHRSWTHFPY